MGYTYTSEPENAVPPKSWAMPKTHTPGSRLEKRGARFYSPETGRWLSNDPLSHRAFRYEVVSASEDEIEGVLQEDDDVKSGATGPVYVFSGNDPQNNVDMLGLKASTCCRQDFETCWAKCIEQERFDWGTVFATVTSTFGFGSMPKTPREFPKKMFGDKTKLSKWTSQVSRWAERFDSSYLKWLKNRPATVWLGRVSTTSLIFEGWYDIHVIFKCAGACSGDPCAY